MSPQPLQLVHVDPTIAPANGDIPVYNTASQLYIPTAGVGTGNVIASGTLTSNQVIIGQGTQSVAALGSLGTTTTVLHGNAAGAPSFATVVEADITLADNTTDDVSTSKHGFTPKAPNNGTFLNSAGAWAAFPMSAATVVTSESTNSTSYTDLSTTGPAVTLTLKGTTAIVWLTAQIQRNGTGNTGLISVAVSGATTVAASDNTSASGVSAANNTSVNIAAVVALTGLTAGSNTFTAKYRVDGNSYNFFNRSIAVFAP